jgi:hypothetical protein
MFFSFQQTTMSYSVWFSDMKIFLVGSPFLLEPDKLAMHLWFCIATVVSFWTSGFHRMFSFSELRLLIFSCSCGQGTRPATAWEIGRDWYVGVVPMSSIAPRKCEKLVLAEACMWREILGQLKYEMKCDVQKDFYTFIGFEVEIVCWVIHELY